MTEQEAFRLVEESLHLLQDSYHWGKIEIEVNEGRIRRVNLTTNVRPKSENDGTMEEKRH